MPTFLSKADETVLSAFSFQYDESVFKRIFGNSFCPFVYVVLFHDRIPKEMIPWDQLNMFEPVPDLVNSIKLYNVIDEELMKSFLNKMSVAKFAYLFHDYYDCKLIPDLENRLLNDKLDFDPISIFYKAVYILADIVDVSKVSSKYDRYCRFSNLVKLAEKGLHLTKEDAEFEFDNNYFNNPTKKSENSSVLIKRILSDYPEFIDEYKEKLINTYYAPLFLKDFISSYEYDPLDPKIVVMLANERGVKSLTDKQIDVLFSLSVKDPKYQKK